jgi:hypothetical protein
MPGYDNRFFNYCFKLNQAVKRQPAIKGKELFGIGAKNDMSLEALIKWVNKNKEEALKQDFHNYSRFLK